MYAPKGVVSLIQSYIVFGQSVSLFCRTPPHSSTQRTQNSSALSFQLVYFQEGALVNYVFIDPAWLCQDVLGKSLAPGNFPVSRIASIGSSQISPGILKEKFAEHIDAEQIPIIIDLLQQFDLCRYLKETEVYEFPALITTRLDNHAWTPNSKFISYCGRKLVCTDDTDSFPPGFFPRVQVKVSSFLKQENVLLFNGSLVVVAEGYQCLIQINDYSTSIDLIGRITTGYSNNCSQLLDQIHGVFSKLIREVCPTIFLQLSIISSSDLKSHHTPPHTYTIGDVIAADRAGHMVTNTRSNVDESVTELLYFGDKQLQKANSGRKTKVAYIPDDVIDEIQNLLQRGPKVCVGSYGGGVMPAAPLGSFRVGGFLFVGSWSEV